MNMQKQILYIYTETPMHVGTGTGLGAVDMPIQREKHTDFPIIQASGVKGALRDTSELALGGNSQEIKSIFGGASGDAGEDFAGALSPSDARILLFPVRALNGVFVWITCPSVLDRFKRETEAEDAPVTPIIPHDEVIALVSSRDMMLSNQVMLEEYVYPAQNSDIARSWAGYLADYALISDGGDFWKDRLSTHLAILPDNEFRDFVRYSTDIVTRIHIDDEKKTVKDGQLFTQELLPADSLLYSVVIVTDTRDEDRAKKIEADQVIQKIENAIGNRIQIGGDETVGRGRVQLKWRGM